MIRMPDIIYLISESYISYTRLYLLIQDGRHNSKWPPAEPKIKISELLDIIFKRSYCLDWGVVDQGIQCQTSLYFQMIFDVFLISIV